MNKLKFYRNKNKYTQKEIAEYLKITQPNYSNIENNKLKLNLEYAILLAKFYKITLAELIDENEIIYITKKELEILSEAKKVITQLESKIKKMT